MARLCYTTPMPHLRRCCSSSTSPPSRHWDPRPAFAAATERVRAGTLNPEDAHHLFDELLLRANPIPERSFNDFLAALARALSSAALRDGHSLALGIFNRVCREEAGPCVTPSTVCTYNILMDSCCRACHPNLGPAFFGRFLRTGLKADQIIAINLLKCLCHAKRKDEAVNMLLHRMSEFGCVPDAISYSIVLKSLCDDSRSQQALDLLQMVRKGGACSLDVVAYSTVIRSFFKEGEVSKACNLFHEMVQQGIVPNVVTYSLIIDALCKVRAMDKAKLVLQQMVDNGVRPNMYTCMELIHVLPLQEWRKQRSCRIF
ncbi:protein Rf1, mitochondrial-like isoform X1 [Triticum dicoccoides]|uniref:protein Rf1, mitochondrial-like isoform X1 n=1 Tax=Triticum dicoccoides TaxID=85692 RepID=UPI00188DFFB1|nr:protein Rf1, mitochondrial-like isoform X1 [Triticum dicoccoides]XP_037484885.1 protein Rf1, mitochondrial-like isoform X1 [Triticum dicoccoides]